MDGGLDNDRNLKVDTIQNNGGTTGRIDSSGRVLTMQNVQLLCSWIINASNTTLTEIPDCSL